MKLYKYDLYRLTGKTDNYTFVKTFLIHRGLRYLYYFRLLKNRKCWFSPIVRMLSIILHKKLSVEIPNSVILGKGVLMIHPYGITVNGKSVIGDNLTILKGATIGNLKTGEKKGSPVIGDNVYIGLNSSVLGGVKIGNNVLIAANSFVNFDVPDGAIVLGSPGVIHLKKNASAPYIINSIKNLLNNSRDE